MKKRIKKSRKYNNKVFCHDTEKAFVEARPMKLAGNEISWKFRVRIFCCLFSVEGASSPPVDSSDCYQLDRDDDDGEKE